ncbi:MAG: DNA polymerase/3'-5' exonuclease PolX [bacterium]
MDNQQFAKILWEIAEFLELKQDNIFKIRAYRKAAQIISSLSVDLGEIYKKGGLKGLQEIPGIGEHIAAKCEEFIKKGKVSAHQKLIKSIHASKYRFLLDNADAHADLIVEDLEKLPAVKKILICGSLRRGQETIGDIDILVVSDQPEKVMTAFVRLSLVATVLAHGPTKSSIVMKNGMQADLRVVEEKSFGAAAHYFTGSKDHNIHLRQLAQKKGWKISEYGIFKGNKQIGGKTEEEMFTKFGLQYIPPELREMRGEFEAAKNKKIPKLVELKNIKGDLHMHTKASDGLNTIEEMAEAAKNLGYKYIAITDHTQSTHIAHGFDEKKMQKQLQTIREADKRIEGIKILAGTEVDIRADGSLDYSDKMLKQLDIVVASVHSRFKMPKEQMTKRIIKALENKYVTILAHPSGRLINEREPYELDLEAVLQAAKKNNVAIELNAHPYRLDLTDIWCKRAKELGVKIVISTDAHSVEQLELMKYGVITARRGWLEAKDILNTQISL